MCVFFFFKQKTAYEVRISDWSSDVCSSDLLGDGDEGRAPSMFYGALMQWLNPKALLACVAGMGAFVAGGEARLVWQFAAIYLRSAERRVGKEGVNTLWSRWSPDDYKNKQHTLDHVRESAATNRREQR